MILRFIWKKLDTPRSCSRNKSHWFLLYSICPRARKHKNRFNSRQKFNLNCHCKNWFHLFLMLPTDRKHPIIRTNEVFCCLYFLPYILCSLISCKAKKWRIHWKRSMRSHSVVSMMILKQNKNSALPHAFTRSHPDQKFNCTQFCN